MRNRNWLHLQIGLALVTLLIGGCVEDSQQPPTLSPPAPTQAAARTASPSPTATPTTRPTFTPAPTDTPAPPPTNTPTPLPPTETPVPSQTPSPPPPTLTSTSTPVPPTVTPAPTATPKPKPPAPTPTRTYRFLPAGPAQPDPSHPCPGCPHAPAYIVGHVTDAAGNPLVGVRLVCYNEWHRYPVVASKGGGEYDFPITQADTTWYVVVLDQNDQPISSETPVTVNLLESCRYILDWRRVD